MGQLHQRLNIDSRHYLCNFPYKQYYEEQQEVHKSHGLSFYPGSLLTRGIPQAPLFPEKEEIFPQLIFMSKM